MKILCLQLARFGDIFMTEPVFKALRREYPQAEIHGLFRERFVAAARMSQSLNQIYTLPSENIFKRLLVEDSLEGALSVIESFTDELKLHKYDLILNFSFSPVSSYLVEALRSETTVVKGYQRHNDGFLNLADDISRYFYAQVGPGRSNRIHVTDLMAQLAEVSLLPADSQMLASVHQAENLKKLKVFGFDYIVFHLGASEAHKRWTPQFWRLLILQFKTFCPEFQLVLVGSQDEILIGNMIEKSLHGDRIVNLVGQTSWEELRDVLSAGRLFVGADSGPMHLAGLVRMPILNLSLGQVNFWETGPKTNLGHVLSYSVESRADLNEIIQAAREMVIGKTPRVGMQGSWASPTFQPVTSSAEASSQFEWKLVEAIYLGSSYPSADKIAFVRGIQDLSELNKLALDAIDKFAKTKIEFLGPYLDRIYESMNVVSGAESLLNPLVNWLRAEKCKVPPMEPQELCQNYHEIHRQFRLLLHPYVLPDDLQEGAHFG